MPKNKISEYIKLIKKEEEKPKKEDLIKKLNYNKTIDSTKKETNLNLLKMPLKNVLSINISEKLKTYWKDSNKIIIDKIIKEENDKILNFILNDLTLNDWIDIFTYKKELKDLDLATKLSAYEIDEIMNFFNRIDECINDDFYNFENDTFCLFIILFYNFERWFFIKGERTTRKINLKNK